MKKINKIIITILFIFYPQFSHAEGLGDITDKIKELAEDIFGMTDSVRVLGLAILVFSIVIWALIPQVRKKLSDHWGTVGIIFVLWVVMMYFGENIKTALNDSFAFQKLIKK